MENLGTVRETLRDMARYLMESALRAKNAGVSTPAFTIEGIIQMAADLIGCVVKIEVATGIAQTSQPKPSLPSKNGDTINDLSRKFIDDMRKESEEIQRKAMEDLRSQFAEMQKKPEPKPVEPVTP